MEHALSPVSLCPVSLCLVAFCLTNSMTSGRAQAGTGRERRVRDPDAGVSSPCSSTFNLSNGYSIQW